MTGHTRTRLGSIPILKKTLLILTFVSFGPWIAGCKKVGGVLGVVGMVERVAQGVANVVRNVGEIVEPFLGGSKRQSQGASPEQQRPAPGSERGTELSAGSVGNGGNGKDGPLKAMEPQTGEATSEPRIELVGADPGAPTGTDRSGYIPGDASASRNVPTVGLSSKAIGQPGMFPGSQVNGSGLTQNVDGQFKVDAIGGVVPLIPGSGPPTVQAGNLIRIPSDPIPTTGAGTSVTKVTPPSQPVLKALTPKYDYSNSKVLVGGAQKNASAPPPLKTPVQSRAKSPIAGQKTTPAPNTVQRRIETTEKISKPPLDSPKRVTTKPTAPSPGGVPNILDWGTRDGNTLANQVAERTPSNGLMILGPMDTMRSEAMNYRDPQGYFSVFTHASPTDLHMYYGVHQLRKEYSASTLAQLIRQNAPPGTSIKLLGCESGADKGIAVQLARLLPGYTIYAPNGYCELKNGEARVYLKKPSEMPFGVEPPRGTFVKVSP